MSDFPSQGLRPTHIGSMIACKSGNHVEVPLAVSRDVEYATVRGLQQCRNLVVVLTMTLCMRRLCDLLAPALTSAEATSP